MTELLSAVDKYRQLILDTERYIWSNPETGYKEYKTSKYLEEQFEKLGYEVVKAQGVTGFYTVIDTGFDGPEILVLGELDSVICPSHKDAYSRTGAVHACGHNAQCAALLGIAAVLKEPDALKSMCGRIKLCAVPAEELIEIEYRSRLISEGKIKYYCGKTEFLHRGYFDSCDIAFMMHISDVYSVTDGSVGSIAKRIIYKGVSSHAGGSPWNGKNALYAASCGINAVNAVRETFKEKDMIRFHPIITRGGDTVNAIPEQATLESYVRGSSYDAIIKANKNINRALIGAALSVGTNIEIIDIPGYAPLCNDKNMIELCKKAAKIAVPQEKLHYEPVITSGSTDMGDLSLLMPIVHPYVAGSKGNYHGSDYQICDVTSACINNAKWQLAMIYMLLCNNATKAKEIISQYKPLFASKKEYLKFIDSINDSGDRIIYKEEKADIRL